MARLQLLGKKFGMLTVLSFEGTSKRGTMWLCRCECGSEKVYPGGNLNNGNTQSCGCTRKQVALKNLSKVKSSGTITHGKSKTRLYTIWKSIKTRCNNPKATDYKNYGGKGVSLCEDWESDFQNFYDWAMSNGYNDKLSIDRIDVNGGYKPSNCRWATNKEQSRNRTDNIFIDIDGVTKTLVDWAEYSNINYGTLQSRYYKGDRGQHLIRPVENKRAK